MKISSRSSVNLFVGRWIRIAIAFGLLVVGIELTLVPCPANEVSPDIIRQAEMLVSAADDMKGEIKNHFQRIKGQAKMTSLNAQVRGRAEAISRRLKRKPDYNGLPRDLKKLVELTRRLEASYKELLTRAEQDRRAAEKTLPVAGKLAAMSELATSMLALGAGGDVPTLIDSSMPTIREYDPRIDIAPGFAPTVATERVTYDASLPPIMESKQQESKMRSVLVK